MTQLTGLRPRSIFCNKGAFLELGKVLTSVKMSDWRKSLRNGKMFVKALLKLPGRKVKEPLLFI